MRLKFRRDGWLTAIPVDNALVSAWLRHFFHRDYTRNIRIAFAGDASKHSNADRGPSPSDTTDTSPGGAARGRIDLRGTGMRIPRQLGASHGKTKIACRLSLRGILRHETFDGFGRMKPECRSKVSQVE